MVFHGPPGPTGRPQRYASPAPGWTWSASALAALAFVGCGRDDIQVYDAPKDQPTAAIAPDPHAGLDMSSGLAATVGTASSRSPIRWQLPAGWKELPASQMRVGNFTVANEASQKAEVTIIPLAGRAGNDLDNVNRWLGQLGSPSLSADQMSELAEAISVAGSDGQLYDLAAPEGQADRKRTLAVILRRGDTAWFFKMTGDDPLVAAQKSVFVEFLKGVRFEAPEPPQGRSAATASVANDGPPLPPGAAAAPPPSLPAGPTARPTPAKPMFTVPSSWEEQAPGPLQFARYVPTSAEGKVEVTVAMLSGDGGGTVANVNRWRRQLSLGPLAQAEIEATLQTLKVAGGEAYLVDLANPDSKQRMLAAGVVRDGQSWFYKLMGDAAAVEGEKSAFVRFVESAKYAP